MLPCHLRVAVFGVIGLSAFAAGCSPSEAPPAAQEPPPRVAPAPQVSLNQIAPDLPPLPDGLFNAPRSPEAVKAAYEFAARHPEVLKYVPCFCGCERMGHKGNDDCFVSSRNAAGQVTAWESHGMVCEICIDVANRAMQMHNSGASTAVIRDAIEKQYAAMAESRHVHTPTPPVPRGRGNSQR
jgi:hypothetical protein